MLGGRLRFYLDELPKLGEIPLAPRVVIRPTLGFTICVQPFEAWRVAWDEPWPHAWPEIGLEGPLMRRWQVGPVEVTQLVKR
jgi:hypothetical protein